MSVALRQGAEQLMTYCVYYLGTHLKVVMELHGKDCLPDTVQARVSLVTPVSSSGLGSAGR